MEVRIKGKKRIILAKEYQQIQIQKGKIWNKDPLV